MPTPTVVLKEVYNILAGTMDIPDDWFVDNYPEFKEADEAIREAMTLIENKLGKTCLL